MANLLDRNCLPIGDFFTQVALGGFPGITKHHLGALAYGIPNNGPFTLWGDNTLYTYPTSAVSVNSLSIASASANDTVAGTGARKVKITGLDTNYAAVTETVSMNGQTPVKLTEEFYRINEMSVYEIGSSLYNIGDVWLGTGTFTAGVPATKYSLILNETNVSENGIFTVPASHYAMIFPPAVSFGFYDGEATVSVLQKENRANAAFEHIFTILTNPTHPRGGDGQKLFPEKTEFQVQVNSCASTPDIALESCIFLIEQSFFDNPDRR